MAAARCCTQAAAGGRSELTPSASAADHIPPACGALAPAAGQQRSSLSRMDADEPGPAPGPHVPGPASKEAPALGAPLHFSPRSHSGGALEAGDHPALRGALAGLGAPHLGPPHARSGAAAPGGPLGARPRGAWPPLGQELGRLPGAGRQAPRGRGDRPPANQGHSRVPARPFTAPLQRSVHAEGRDAADGGAAAAAAPSLPPGAIPRRPKKPRSERSACMQHVKRVNLQHSTRVIACMPELERAASPGVYHERQGRRRW